MTELAYELCKCPDGCYQFQRHRTDDDIDNPELLRRLTVAAADRTVEAVLEVTSPLRRVFSSFVRR